MAGWLYRSWFLQSIEVCSTKTRTFTNYFAPLSSPGWIEVAVIAYIAKRLEKIVKSVSSSICRCKTTYHTIMVGLEQRKLLRLKVRRAELALKKQELRFIEQSLRQMSKIINLPIVKELNSRTGHPYIALKVLLSLYRRVRTLANYQNEGRVDFRNKK